MNIEQLKSEWTRYNERLSVSEQLNDHLITSMLKERSRSRVAAIRQSNVFYLALMFMVITALFAVLAGNPFDFAYTWQYVPYVILTIGVFITIVSLIRNIQTFSVDLNKVDLSNFLTQTIRAYEKKKKMDSLFGIIMFSGGVLTILSFLPKKLEHKDLWPALGETAVGLGITLGIYLIAFKAGAFKDRRKTGFENDLNELNRLKAISVDLSE